MHFASYSILFLNQGLYLVVGLRALFALFIKNKGMPIIKIITEALQFLAVLAIIYFCT